MTEQFARSLLKVSVAQICQNVGWHAVHTTPCELLTDILHRYLEELAKTTHRYTAQYGRTEPNLDDLALAFKDINIPLGELEEYVTQVDAVPFAHDIPTFPVSRSNNFQHPKPGSKELLQRPEWVHEHLPAHYLETDDIESTPSPAPPELIQASTPKRLNSEIIPISEVSSLPNKCHLESPSDNSTPKRARLTSDEENCLPHEMTSVSMTPSGFLSPVREGKLPEAKTPSKIKSLNEESNSSDDYPKAMKDVKKEIEHINGILPCKVKESSEKDKNKFSNPLIKSKPKNKTSSKSNSSKSKKKSQTSLIRTDKKNSKTTKTSSKNLKVLSKSSKTKSPSNIHQVVSPLQLFLNRSDNGNKIEKISKLDKILAKVAKFNSDQKVEEVKIKEEIVIDDSKNIDIKLDNFLEKQIIKHEIAEVPSRDDSPEPRLVIDDDPNRQTEQDKINRLAAMDAAIDAVIKRSVAEVEQEGRNDRMVDDTIDAVVRGPLSDRIEVDKSYSPLPRTPTISPPSTPTIHSPTIKVKKQKSPKNSSIEKERKKKSLKEKSPKEKLPKEKKEKTTKEKPLKFKLDDKNKKVKEKIKEKIQIKSGLKINSLHPLPRDIREENFMHSFVTHSELALSPLSSPSLATSHTARTSQSPVVMPFNRGMFSLPNSPQFQYSTFYHQHRPQYYYSPFPTQNFHSSSQNFPSLSHAHWLAPLAQVRYQSISSPERVSPTRSPSPPKLGVGISPTLQRPLTPKSPSVSPRPTLTLDRELEKFENKRITPRDKLPKRKHIKIVNNLRWTGKHFTPPKKKHIKIVNNLRWSGKHLTAKRKEHKKDKKKDRNKDKDKDLPKTKKKKEKDKDKDKHRDKLKDVKETESEKVKSKGVKEKAAEKEKDKEKDHEKEKDRDREKEKDKEKTKSKDKDKKDGKEKKEKKEGKEKDKHKSSKEPPPGATGSATPSIPKITVKFGGGSTPDVPKIVIKPLLPPEPITSKPPSPVRVATPPLPQKPPTPKPAPKIVSSPPTLSKSNPLLPQPVRASTPVQRTVITETVGAILDEGGQKIWICPACTHPDDGSPMIGCDDCDDWYHWVCVGIVDPPDEEENWYCPRCQSKKKEQKKKRKKRHRSSLDYN